tara:strand:+ start:578 stop:907 length:330 start_codon:yes stop_codon:yes gene_type:complete
LGPRVPDNPGRLTKSLTKSVDQRFEDDVLPRTGIDDHHTIRLPAGQIEIAFTNAGMEDCTLSFHAIEQWIQSASGGVLIDIEDDCQVRHEIAYGDLAHMIDRILRKAAT